MKKKKETVRTKCFDHIMELCHRRIRNIASYGGLNCFYEIPGLLIGYPLYNLHDCTQYVIEKLRGTGFLVQLLPPPHVSVVYISWDPQELKPRRPALMGPSPSSKSKRPMMIGHDSNAAHPVHGIQISHDVRNLDKKTKITNPLKDRFRIF